MLSRLLIFTVASTHLFTSPAIALDLRRSTIPGNLPRLTGTDRLGDGEVSVNATDRRLMFKNVDGSLGYGSLLNAIPSGRDAVERGYASGLTLDPVVKTAIRRSLLDKIADFSLSIKDFGAVMNGLTDDTPAFNRAVAALVARGGGKLVVPEGRIALKAATLDTNNVLIQCAYEGATTIVPMGPTDTPIILGGGTTIRYNLGIDRCYFEQAPGSAGQTAGSFVSVSSVNKSVISHFRMANGFTPISITGNSVVNLVDAGEIYNTATAGALIHIDADNDQYVSKVNADGPIGAQPSAGIRIVSSGGTWLTDLDLIHSGSGLLIAPPSGKSVKWVFGSNTAFDSGVNGVNIAPTGTGIVYGVLLDGLWTSANINYGALVAGGDTIEFAGYRSISNGYDGALIVAPATNVTIRGGASCGNGSSAAGVYSGINIGSGVQGVTVTAGARIGNCVGTGTNQLRAIVLQPSTTTNNIAITGNDLRGNSGQAVSDNVTTVNADIRIEQNRGLNPVGTSSKTVGSSPFTYTAGRTSEMLNLTGGTLSSVTIQGVQVCASSPCATMLPPNKTVVITYSAAPTLAVTAD